MTNNITIPVNPLTISSIGFIISGLAVIILAMTPPKAKGLLQPKIRKSQITAVITTIVMFVATAYFGYSSHTENVAKTERQRIEKILDPKWLSVYDKLTKCEKDISKEIILSQCTDMPKLSIEAFELLLDNHLCDNINHTAYNDRIRTALTTFVENVVTKE